MTPTIETSAAPVGVPIAPAGETAWFRRAASWPLALLRAIAEVYRKGFLAFALAPAIVAMVVLPEAVQHVVEIKLGMFDSLTDFRANGADPLRMGIGYVKIAGLVLCALATARFWHVGSVGKALLIPPRDLARSLFALVIGFAASLPLEWSLRTAQPPQIQWPVIAVSWTLSFLLFVYLMGALFGDRKMTLRTAFTRGWRVVPLLAILLVVAFWPASTLHMLIHKFALGKAPALVWAVMAGDALLVGLLATLTGSALAVSYRRGFTAAP
jgi:hypothetical protein